jgi:hypothetical protein
MTRITWWEQLIRNLHTPRQREQERRTHAQTLDRARSGDDVVGERESRRLAGMSAEDRAWEQASLMRNRDAQDRPAS